AKRGKTDIHTPNEWLELARCDYFVTEKAIVSGQWTLSTSPDTFTVLIVAGGEGSLSWSGASSDANDSLPLQPGACLLLPANLGTYTLDGNMTVLRSRLP